MTREQQKKLREIRKALPKIIQSEIKKYGFKKKDYMVWHKKEQLFFTLFLFEREMDGRCYIDTTIDCKPLWIDDLLWDILHMPENKSEPLSLRSVGAFTVRGNELYSESIELSNWSVDEAAECVQNALLNFGVYIENTQPENFSVQIDTNPYHAEVRKLLLLIHENKFDDAINFANNMDRNVFENQGVGLRAGAIQYCMQRKR